MKLLHLYADVMNLYGEYANVAVLARYLTSLGQEVTVETLSLYESRDISGYDFYYMGAGTERKQKLALSQLLQYREALRAALDGGKVLLFTGNAFELLGRKITDANGREYEALGLADFETVESKRRITGDVLADSPLLSAPLVGFMNKCGKTTGVQAPFCRVKMGFGNDVDRGAEGFAEKHCIGTHLTGPLLVKNPSLLRYMAGLLGVAEDASMLPHLDEAYAVTKAELEKRLEAQQ